MIFVLFSANILFVLTVCLNAKPMDLDRNSVRIFEIPDQFAPEESHPFEAIVSPKEVPALEVSDDDQYEAETAPVRVVAVPQNRPQVYRLINNGQDLSASASDLQAAASGYGGGHGGWLDMGAYSSGHGAFGWYSDYPVGGHGR